MFIDRTDAGRQLAARLTHLRHEPAVVLALPRGGVPVAAEVAAELHAPLDVIVVRKLGTPAQPELAMGAISEEGARVMNDAIVRDMRVGDDEIAAVEAHERDELQRRVADLRSIRPAAPLAGRTAVIVDDGIATGATARVACLLARARGAARVVLAVPVAPAGWQADLGHVADECIAVDAPRSFGAVGRFYRDFSQVSDETVADLLRRAWQREGTVSRSVEVVTTGGHLAGELTTPPRMQGLIVFAHGSGSSRLSPRNRQVARLLGEAGFGTLLFDLLTDDESRHRDLTFDIELLAGRLAEATAWLRTHAELADVPIGWFGASTGAAAALWAAAEPGADVAAVVSRGGRPDLAMARLHRVTAPTLLIVGGDDEAVLELNRRALAALRCESHLTVIPGATHLFDEPGALEAVARCATEWFSHHLVAGATQVSATGSAPAPADARRQPPSA